MPPTLYAIAGVLVWNWRRDEAGKVTISQWSRAHPFTFLTVVTWLIPHVLRGSHLVDRIARVLNRVRR